MMNFAKVSRLVTLACLVSHHARAFIAHPFKKISHHPSLMMTLQQSSGDATDDALKAFGNATKDVMDDVSEFLDKDRQEREALKQTMLQLGASYDRGFGASPKARKDAESTIVALELLNPETWAAKGILGNETSPLAGSWRMVWTNAQDVLILGASPVATIGAIYQVFEPPVVTNIIDFIPRAQALLPPSLAMNTQVRAEVTTRASIRPNYRNRIGLDFEKVAVKPIEILGQNVSLPPLAFDLPRISLPEDGPGYFDTTYLDEEMLIIRQNAPGGKLLFVATTFIIIDPDSPPLPVFIILKFRFVCSCQGARQ
jgi:hypothetical protein